MLLHPLPGRTDHVVHGGARGVPVHEFTCASRVRDQCRWIASTARAKGDGKLLSSDPVHRVNDLANGETVPRPQVDGTKWCVQSLDRGDVGVSKIGNMNIVPNRRAIGSRVVRAKDGEGFTLSEEHLEGDRNDVCFGMVILTPLVRSTGNVEVSKGRVIETVPLGINGQ